MYERVPLHKVSTHEVRYIAIAVHNIAQDSQTQIRVCSDYCDST